MHTECPVSANQILKAMPSDDNVGFLYEAFESPIKDEGSQWNEGKELSGQSSPNNSLSK